MNKNDLCEILLNISPGKCSKRKTVLKMPILWLGIIEINSRVISSLMIGKIVSKNAGFWKTGHNFFQNLSGSISAQKRAPKIKSELVDFCRSDLKYKNFNFVHVRRKVKQLIFFACQTLAELEVFCKQLFRCIQFGVINSVLKMFRNSLETINRKSHFFVCHKNSCTVKHTSSGKCFVSRRDRDN